MKYYAFVRVIINQNKSADEVAEMINEYKDKPKPVPGQPVPNPLPGPKKELTTDEQNEELVNIRYQELEDEYGISGFIEEEAAKAEIKKLNCDKEKIKEWIENTLINGE